MIKKLKNPFVLEFLLPAIISVCFAYFLKWNARELVWSFWSASYALSLIFCLLVLFVTEEKTGFRFLASLGSVLIFLLIVSFHQYTSRLIASSGLVPELDEARIDYIGTFLTAFSKFYPFIILCVFIEIKKLYNLRLSFLRKFLVFIEFFIRLQFLAWICLFCVGKLPDIIVYLITYFICYLPLNLFHNKKHDLERMSLS